MMTTHRGNASPDRSALAYWARTSSLLMDELGARTEGLTSHEARERLAGVGKNVIAREGPSSRGRLLWQQGSNPLVVLLLVAACISAATGEWPDAIIVAAIVLTTVGVGYRRARRAEGAATALAKRLTTWASVVRDGVDGRIPADEVVPGDIVLLSAGNLVPADGVVLDATDFFVGEAVLTGESFPVSKAPGLVVDTTPLARRSNCVFLGTNVRSGSARCLVVATGKATAFGAIARRLSLRPPETEFDRGVRHFGYLLTIAMLLLVLVVFATHMIAGRAPVETLLFAIAIAVGLSPELLPAILTFNLARGAEQMAKHGVLVRHINAIENLGSMDILCTDKTGTLTQGVVQVEGAYDADGQPSTRVLELAALNAALASGIASPLDEAILAIRNPELNGYTKLAELPFDAMRKRVSVVTAQRGETMLVTKGACREVLSSCARRAGGDALDDVVRTELVRRANTWGDQGVRVIAVATRAISASTHYRQADERELTFEGYVTFSDRPKPGAASAVAGLAALGVAVKVITGDSARVARHVAHQVGLRAEQTLTGLELDTLNDEALWNAAERTDVFAEVDPNQKERILLALKKMGHVVGFLGDGVNDAPAMHAADVSISVDTAVDVARAAADMILLEHDLDVIRRGITTGRTTFANTLKYVLTTSSANLGNMVSMAAVSLFLPFLPLLAGQILLNNFISDIPAIGIADDNVDPELVDRPRRWSMSFIGRFMVEFGLLSSAFDAITFFALVSVFHASASEFRTAWFVESLLTELVIALVVRTRRPFWRSRPGTLLATSTVVLLPMTLALPYLPGASKIGFEPLPSTVLASLTAIAAMYVIATEVMKRWFYGRMP